MTNTAIYLRSSKDRKDVSPDAQRRALQALAKSRDLSIVAEFSDVVLSGKDENRPGFQSMVRAVRDPRRGWDTLLIHDTSRLARNRVTALIFEEVECKRAGVHLIYKSLPDLDPLTAMVVKAVFQAWDEYHSIVSKEKGLAGMGENVRAGFRAGGQAPTGYQLARIETGTVREGAAVTKSRLEPDPETAPAVTRYLQERAAGVPRRDAKTLAGGAIAAMANTSLIGIEWNALTYAGQLVWNVHAERSGGSYVGGNKRRPRAEWLIQPDAHPALISEQDAETILGRLERKARDRKSGVPATRARTSDALLGGLLYAPDGSKWWAEADRYRWQQRDGGSRSIPRAAIEDPVLDRVLSDVASAEFAEQLVDGTRRALAESMDPNEVRRLRERAVDLAERIGRTMDLVPQMTTPGPALRKIDQLERERLQAVADLQVAEAAAAAAAAIASITPADVARVLTQITADAKGDARSELRASVLSIVDRIELDPETLSAAVHYRIEAPMSGVKLASPRRSDLNPRPVLRHRVEFTLPARTGRSWRRAAA